MVDLSLSLDSLSIYPSGSQTISFAVRGPAFRDRVGVSVRAWFGGPQPAVVYKEASAATVNSAY